MEHSPTPLSTRSTTLGNVPPNIETKALSLYYGTKKALHDIDMQIFPKTVTAFIGPSGCGKSTFLRCLNRMNDLIDHVKIEGKVFIDGQDIYDKTTEVNALRKKVGMVFQKPTPFPKSIFDNVAYGLYVNGVRKKNTVEEKVEKALRQAALWDEVKDELKKSALSLSGGQQQRLCIARTIAIEPEIILMDEPTSALDPLSTLKIEELIQELRKNYTIVIVTHNMQQAKRISDKTAFFYLGKLVEYDNSDTIFNNPTQEQTRQYVSGKFG
ncbi:MAG: phosphate ABC transporter ATP-binding protein PstB [Flammeovirgaceae bacterium]|nr:phosphate ABC transporter ATP-binding protein PstB [Flammeovirgaceae bacterium]